MTDRELNEALSLLDAIDQEERNWRNARARVGELLKTARAAVADRAQHTKLRDEIKAMESQKPSLEQSIRTLQGQVADIEDDLRDARKARKLKTVIDERERHLAEVEEKVDQAERRLSEAQSAFDSFKAKLA